MEAHPGPGGHPPPDTNWKPSQKAGQISQEEWMGHVFAGDDKA